MGALHHTFAHTKLADLKKTVMEVHTTNVKSVTE